MSNIYLTFNMETKFLLIHKYTQSQKSAQLLFGCSSKQTHTHEYIFGAIHDCSLYIEANIQSPTNPVRITFIIYLEFSHFSPLILPQNWDHLNLLRRLLWSSLNLLPYGFVSNRLCENYHKFNELKWHKFIIF